MTRLALAEGLTLIGAGAKPALSEILADLVRDPERAVARKALEALGRQPTSNGVEVAIIALRRRVTRNAAMRALASFGPAVAGRLSQELGETTNYPRTAAALTWVLGRLATASAVPAIVAALERSHVEVRLGAAIALNSLHRQRPDIQLPLEEIEKHYRPELDYYAHTRRGARLDLPAGTAWSVLRSSFKQHSQASLECLVRLLALKHPEDSLRGVLGAMASNDSRQRQLAVELLDTMLPPSLRHALAEMAKETTADTQESTEILQQVAGGNDRFMSHLARAVLTSLGETPVGEPTTGVSGAAMSETLIQDILELQSVGLFRSTSAEDLAEIVTLLRPHSISRGTVIFREGDRGDAMYVVRQGKVTLSAHGEVVEHIEQGEAFGFIAVLDQQPRELTATATTDCELSVLEADDLAQLLAERPLFMHSIFRALTDEIRNKIGRMALRHKVGAA